MRRAWPLLIALTAALLLAPGAASAEAAYKPGSTFQHPTQVIIDDGDPARPYDRWLANANVPSPDVTIRIYERPCAGPEHVGGIGGSCVAPARNAEGEMAMWLGDRTRLTFLHEVGHIVDVEWLRQEHRKRFARILGKHPWPYCLDGRCGATAWTQETFATVYASCGYPARGRVGRRRGFWIDDAWIMRTHKHRAACQLIRYRGYRSLVFGERGSY